MPDTAVVVVRCAVTAALASVRPSAAALVTTRKVRPPQVRTTRGPSGTARIRRYATSTGARRELAAITSLSRVKKCGRVSTNEGGEVSLHHTPGPEGEPGTAGFGGLATCGSVWACPVCSAKISARRSKDLEQLINWNADRGARSHC
ncbi:hypothetical protein [Pseudonocardia sp. Ae717_Ps2]|uniref:hypothetical protein n=1 Tax=Pseudonocardia sp. Ae717_Ps2 TaxID=1885573 RepID=UPI001179DE47|nr:hypothetical protein [Pseudonocardia sp. Ae717_Ps2]